MGSKNNSNISKTDEWIRSSNLLDQTGESTTCNILDESIFKKMKIAPF